MALARTVTQDNTQQSGPEQTIESIDWFFSPWVPESERDRIVEDHARTTLREDIDLCEKVQIGRNNLGYDRGRSVTHWQNLWRPTMGEDVVAR